MFPNYIETKRLQFKPVHQEMNPKELYKHCSDQNEHIDDITEHIMWDKHESVLKSINILSNMRSDWVNGISPHYHISQKSDDNFVGLTSIDIDHKRKQGEIGLWLRKEYWGQEFSKERAYAMIEIGFDELDLNSIIVRTASSNIKSQKAIENYIYDIGGEKDGQITDNHLYEDGTVKDSIIYSITKDNYKSQFSNKNSLIEEINW